ncbi:tRNA (adenosine(37)-N6)-dimethylallyltransferase MiaA [Ornithinimicrobium sp. Arc0846-15]|nr:tRNA (adenosine(37)-N6)-dimethylallyltransferase MiaA [Ornithinimicrobium laminariae]
MIALVGATATGKSDLALRIAAAVPGSAQIINADASQLYAGMNIGTAKLPPEQRQGVPHHQLDVLGLLDTSTVADYQTAARKDLAAIRAAGDWPIVVGGSGLYVRALLDRLEIPPTDADVRAKWEAELEAHGPAELFAQLQDADPAAAGAMDPRNGRRIVRALEVIEITGKPFSATMPQREFMEPTLLIGLSAPRPVLHARIRARVEQMWGQGLLAEVARLEQHGLRKGKTSSRALGYAQALAQLDGEMTEEEAQEATVFATQRFARRQDAWFGADPRIQWLPHEAEDLFEQAIALVAQFASEVGVEGLQR